jgi:hypothetical protein
MKYQKGCKLFKEPNWNENSASIMLKEKEGKENKQRKKWKKKGRHKQKTRKKKKEQGKEARKKERGEKKEKKKKKEERKKERKGKKRPQTTMLLPLVDPTLPTIARTFPSRAKAPFTIVAFSSNAQ